MKKQGSASLIVLIIAVVVLTITVVGMGVYIFTSNNSSTQNVDNENLQQTTIEEKLPNSETEELKGTVVEQKVDPRKYHVTNDLNEEKDVHWYSKDIIEHEYMLGFFDDTDNGIKTRIGIGKEGNIWVYATISGKEVFSKTFSSSLFAKKVDEIEIVDFGSGGQNAIVYFLLEDGSVEYIDLAELLVKEDISTKKKIEGLSNIVRIERINAGPAHENGGGGKTGVAIDIDGKWTILDKYAESVLDNTYYTQTLQNLVNKYEQK